MSDVPAESRNLSIPASKIKRSDNSGKYSNTGYTRFGGIIMIIIPKRNKNKLSLPSKALFFLSKIANKVTKT